MSLRVLWLTLSVYSAPPHIEALYEQMVADELAIKLLLERFNCSHVYFDMGANIGVQIRKLHEATLYPHAPAVRLFDATFGPAPHCDVCAIAIEPNPRHALRLAQLKENYHRARSDRCRQRRRRRDAAERLQPHGPLDTTARRC